jgi:hypothetical protein
MTKAHETRIPNKFIDMVGEGEITLSMLFVMMFLYRWVTWKTGVVPKVSAGVLAAWSQGAYSPTTFKEALQRLELCGHITRHMTLGSHKSYPVTINNFRVARKMVKDGETVLIVITLNKVNTVTWTEYQNGARPEPIPDASPDGCPDGSPEGCPDGWQRPCRNKQDSEQDELQENEQERAGEEGGEAADAPPPIASDDSTSRNIWDTWSEQVGSIPASQVRQALLYHLKYNRRPYWRDKKLSPALIRLKARELVDDVPVDWQEPVASAAAAASGTDRTSIEDLED